MEPYEYVLTFISIIVGLGVADLLISLQRLLRARARVRWDWAAPATAAAVLMLNVMIWWSLYDPKGQTLTIGAFVPVLVQLVLLFLLTCATLPDEVPAEGISLRDYYAGNRAFVWTLFSAVLGWTLLIGVVRMGVAGASWAHIVDSRLADVLVLALMVSMALVKARWWHALVLGLLMLSGPIAWLSRSVAG